MHKPEDKGNLSALITALQKALKSTAYWNLYDDIEKCPVPDSYHKTSHR